MAKYNGTIVLSGMISPTDTLDQYPTHEDTLGKGGYMILDNIIARDNIPTGRRKNGMLVYISNTDEIYQLKGGIDNSKWVVFTTPSSNKLIPSTISVSALINDIFIGVTIPDGEIAYIVNNGDTIDDTIRYGILKNILTQNVYNNFIIVYNGTSSTVYYNSLVGETFVEKIINGYPVNYEILNLSLTPLSQKISNLLSTTYVNGIQFYAVNGIMSRCGNDKNTFRVLSDLDEFVVAYNGTSYNAFKRIGVAISELQSKKILS